MDVESATHLGQDGFSFCIVQYSLMEKISGGVPCLVNNTVFGKFQ